jgi:hypothetical protein
MPDWGNSLSVDVNTRVSSMCACNAVFAARQVTPGLSFGHKHVNEYACAARHTTVRLTHLLLPGLQVGHWLGLYHTFEVSLVCSSRTDNES